MNDWINTTAVSIDCLHVTCILHVGCLSLGCFSQCPHYKQTKDAPTYSDIGAGEK